MCVLKGFPTALAKNATDASDYPFGLWFANPTTLYVADEGAGDNAFANGSYTAAAASTTAGLQKWVYNAAAGQWQLAYTLQNGLNLGAPYTVRGYPTGVNSVTGLPWAPATDGLRNLTGQVNRNGTVSIWAVTSTVSGGGDQGADPNQLVEITDSLKATAAPSRRAVRHRRARPVRPGGAGRVVHARHRHGLPRRPLTRLDNFIADKTGNAGHTACPALPVFCGAARRNSPTSEALSLSDGDDLPSHPHLLTLVFDGTVASAYELERHP